MKTKFGIKEVVAIGIGTALFIVLTNVQVPLGPIPNTSLQSRVAVLTFFSAIYGPIVGAAVGFIGHALGDAILYGGVWWSWVIPELIYGIGVGMFAAKYKVKEGGFGKKEIIFFNVVQVIANLITWLVAAPLLDVIIYKEPALKVIAQGAGASLGNILVAGILGTMLLAAYSKVGAKSGSLKKED